MHVITKILVVFAAVLSVLLAALAISYSTNAPRITSQLLNERLSKETAMRQLDAANAANVEQVAGLQKQLDDVANQLGALRRDKEGLMLDNAKLLAQAKTAEAAALAVQARIDQLAATGQTQATLIDAMYKEVSKLRENELKYAQREIEYTDRFNDLNAQLEVARETNRALQEQIAQIQADRARQGGSAVTSAPGTPRTASTPIVAQITNVRKDVSGDTLAQIDAGTSDRITQGMKLSIVRGTDEFLGWLEVTDSTLNESVGKVTVKNNTVQVRPGDRVLTAAR